MSKDKTLRKKERNLPECEAGVGWKNVSRVDISALPWSRREVLLTYVLALLLQMFMAITRQVLRTKKESKERQAIQNNDTVNLGSKRNNKNKKSKCC